MTVIGKLGHDAEHAVGSMTVSSWSRLDGCRASVLAAVFSMSCHE